MRVAWFSSVCGVNGESCLEFSCGVCEGNVSVHEGDEAITTITTTTPACSIMSESCVIRKLGCVMSVGIEFSFLNECYVYLVIV